MLMPSGVIVKRKSPQSVNLYKSCVYDFQTIAQHRLCGRNCVMPVTVARAIAPLLRRSARQSAGRSARQSPGQRGAARGVARGTARDRVRGAARRPAFAPFSGFDQPVTDCDQGELRLVGRAQFLFDVVKMGADGRSG
jgi:hypothetical protein